MTDAEQAKMIRKKLGKFLDLDECAITGIMKPKGGRHFIVEKQPFAPLLIRPASYITGNTLLGMLDGVSTTPSSEPDEPVRDEPRILTT